MTKIPSVNSSKLACTLRSILVSSMALYVAGCAAPSPMPVNQTPQIMKPDLVSGTAPGNSRAGFIRLHGAAAAEFVVPADVRLVRESNLKARQLISRRFQQLVGNAEVFGGQFTVLYSAAGEVIEIFGAYFPELVPTNDIKMKGDAAQVVAAAKIGNGGQWSTRLMINPKDGRYFYEVENQRSDSRWFHWIDAENGSIINAYDGLTTGDGIGVLGDTKKLTGLTTRNGTSFEMKSADGRQSVHDARNSFSKGELATDDNDTWDTPGTTSPGQGAIVDAQFYTAITDRYFKDTHQFDWVTFYPQGLVSIAHVGKSYANASWNGAVLSYGDGDDVDEKEQSAALDTVGHEIGHGVTEATSGLIYENESGALNEAFSDIMGTNIQFTNGKGNWSISEDSTIDGKGIRNMADPLLHKYGSNSYPSHYADRYKGSWDNGGVHINSSIVNHWYYLLVKGGQNANPQRASGKIVQGIGQAAAEKIAFVGFTHLSSSADFCAARASTMAFADAYKANVAMAWNEVGVDAALCGSDDGTTTADGREQFRCVVRANDTQAVRDCCEAEGKSEFAKCIATGSKYDSDSRSVTRECEQEENNAYNFCIQAPGYRKSQAGPTYTERAPQPMTPSSSGSTPTGGTGVSYQESEY